MATISLVLIIACANIANLSLARAAADGGRSPCASPSARAAGGSCAITHESLTVGLFGGAAALLISAWVLRLLYPIGMSLLPETWTGVVLDLTPDVRVFLYTLLLSLTAAVIFGLVPALQTSSPQISAALREDGTFLGKRAGQSTARDVFVVVQIAVCLMLLAAAALTARSLQRPHPWTSVSVPTVSSTHTPNCAARLSSEPPRSSTGASTNARRPCQA